MNDTENFVQSLVGPIQVLADTQAQMLSGRILDNAVGANLATIGKIVGAPTKGASGAPDDDTYRRIVRAQIVTNKSDGLVEDLIAIAGLVVGDPAATYVVRDTGIASVVVEVSGVVLLHPLARLLVGMLRRGKAGGVRLVLEHHPTDPSLEFAFDGGSDGAGWGDALDAGVGGPMSGALE